MSGQVASQIEGKVVAIDSVYMGDCDSMYYAVYFDIESGEFKRHAIGYGPGGAKVDASDEIREAYLLHLEAIKARQHALRVANSIVARIREEKAEASTPRPGKRVEVVKGRKIPLGTEATVEFYGDTAYGVRVLLLLEDGSKVWTNPSNVSVIQADLVSA